jgi:hypothetical protein
LFNFSEIFLWEHNFFFSRRLKSYKLLHRIADIDSQKFPYQLFSPFKFPPFKKCVALLKHLTQSTTRPLEQTSAETYGILVVGKCGVITACEKYSYLQFLGTPQDYM